MNHINAPPPYQRYSIELNDITRQASLSIVIDSNSDTLNNKKKFPFSIVEISCYTGLALLWTTVIVMYIVWVGPLFLHYYLFHSPISPTSISVLFIKSNTTSGILLGNITLDIDSKTTLVQISNLYQTNSICMVPELSSAICTTGTNGELVNYVSLIKSVNYLNITNNDSNYTNQLFSFSTIQSIIDTQWQYDPVSNIIGIHIFWKVFSGANNPSFASVISCIAFVIVSIISMRMLNKKSKYFRRFSIFFFVCILLDIFISFEIMVF
jgi:hypothetical protein